MPDHQTTRPLLPLALLAALACTAPPTEEADTPGTGDSDNDTVRIALFNLRELSLAKLREGEGARGENEQLLAAAEIVADVDPDLLVVQEIDFVADRPLLAAELLRDRYLIPAGSLGFEHLFAAPSNTGVLSGLDLNNDGRVATESDLGSRQYGEDSFGFGTYPGQYAMAVLSKRPLLTAGARTFQTLLWRDLPRGHLPHEFYEEREIDLLRLSSKSHWDLPVAVGGEPLHLLISHPTPPVFDGDEDRNGRRNFDEIGFWRHYLDGAELTDDAGDRSPFSGQSRFLLVGDLNASPNGEPAYDGRTAISQLLEHPRVTDSGRWLTAEGALAGRSPGPPSHPEQATATFGNGSRVDYLLPSNGLEIVDAGLFWPADHSDPEGAELAARASDHRLVWLELRLSR